MQLHVVEVSGCWVTPAIKVVVLSATSCVVSIDTDNAGVVETDFGDDVFVSWEFVVVTPVVVVRNAVVVLFDGTVVVVDIVAVNSGVSVAGDSSIVTVVFVAVSVFEDVSSDVVVNSDVVCGVSVFVDSITVIPCDEVISVVDISVVDSAMFRDASVVNGVLVWSVYVEQFLRLSPV